MKKIIALMLAIVTLCCGCGKTENVSSKPTPVILSTSESAPVLEEITGKKENWSVPQAFVYSCPNGIAQCISDSETVNTLSSILNISSDLSSTLGQDIFGSFGTSLIIALSYDNGESIHHFAFPLKYTGTMAIKDTSASDNFWYTQACTNELYKQVMALLKIEDDFSLPASPVYQKTAEKTDWQGINKIVISVDSGNTYLEHIWETSNENEIALLVETFSNGTVTTEHKNACGGSYIDVNFYKDDGIILNVGSSLNRLNTVSLNNGKVYWFENFTEDSFKNYDNIINMLLPK